MKRSIMVGLALVIGLFLVAILVLPVLLDLNRYRDRYLSALEQVLHRPVDVQDVRLTIFPTLGVRVRGITIADDPTFSPIPFITIPSAEVVVQWAPLLFRRIQVKRIVLQDPTVHVIRTQEGVLNTATIGKPPAPHPPREGVPKAEDPLESWLGVLAVERFSMIGGTMRYEDRSQEQMRSYQLDSLTFMTDAVQIGQTANIHVTGMVMPYGLSLEMSGRFGPLQPTLDVPMIDIVGKLGKVEATAQGRVMDGRFELDVQIPQMSTDDIPMDLVLAKPVTLSHIRARMIAPLFSNDRLSLSSGVRVDPLTLDLQLGGSTMHLSGKGTPGHLSLVGESPVLSSQDFPLALGVHHPFSLEQIRFETVIQGARVDLVSFMARSFKGSLEAQGRWDGTPTVPMLSLQGTFNHFSVEPIVQTIDFSPLSLTGTGELHWSVAGSFPSSGHPSLDGPVRLRIQNGQLVGFNLVQVIEEALQLSGLLGESTWATKFSLIDINGDLEGTGLVIRQLIMDATDFFLEGVGRIGFDHSVKLKGILVMSPAIGDEIIQQFPMAKVLRKQNQLAFPFTVNGTVQEPVLRLDTKAFGDQVKKNVERRIEKALEGDEQELQQLLKDGKDLLKQLFGN